MTSKLVDSLQIEFNDNSILSSLFGVADSNIQLLEKIKIFNSVKKNNLFFILYTYLSETLKKRVMVMGNSNISETTTGTTSRSYSRKFTFFLL